MLQKTKNPESIKREKRIVKRLNLSKLPFKLSMDDFCGVYVDLIQQLRVSFKYEDDKPGMQWCLKNIKRFKVFLLIFEANELGNEIYKESISNKLPEYSYKTIAQIIDEGVTKNLFINLPARLTESHDLKIRNIRPSEDLSVEFINWNIDIITSLSQFVKKQDF